MNYNHLASDSTKGRYGKVTYGHLPQRICMVVLKALSHHSLKYSCYNLFAVKSSDIKKKKKLLNILR